LRNKSNFTTLGVGISSRWKKKEVWKSGTSFATPIAAGLAANVLEFANFHCTGLFSYQRDILKKPRGMEALFYAMSESREEYDFVHAIRLWDGKSDGEVAECIEKVIQSL